MASAHEWRRGEHAVSTDPARLDLAVVHGFLARSYWSPGIPIETVRRAIAGSLPFGLYLVAPDTPEGTERQIGFARAISDRATFAYLADVFVIEPFRGRGLGKWLVETIVSHPDLQGLRRWALITRDAHAVYRAHGFAPLASPDRWMERAAGGGGGRA